MKLDIQKIKVDGGTQPRASIDIDVVNEYAEAFKQGAKFPPVVVFFDGKIHWLADGFHRRGGASLAGLTKIDAEIKQGTQRDAILYSVGVNSSHGLRRTNEDKRRAVTRLLEDAEWGKWSDRAIAEKCAVGHAFVSNLRQLSMVDSSTPRIGLDGKERSMPRPALKPVVNEMDIDEEEGENDRQEEMPNVEVTIRMAKDYMDILFEDYPNLIDKHFICNSVLKYLRQRAIEFNVESV